MKLGRWNLEEFRNPSKPVITKPQEKPKLQPKATTPAPKPTSYRALVNPMSFTGGMSFDDLQAMGLAVRGLASGAKKALKVDNPGDMGTVWNYFVDGDFSNGFGTLWNGISRKYSMKFGTDDSDVVTNIKMPQAPRTDTQYALRESLTGDTIRVNNRRYILPESLDVSEFTFKARNRGENTPIQSEAAPITAFNAFKPYGKHDRGYNTYLGVDAQGRLKVGPISSFGTGDLLTGTFSNDIVSFKKDKQNNTVYKRDGAHGNGSRSVPVVLTKDGKEGSLNILTDTNLKGNTYGNISGGRVLVRVGNELKLLSGSIDLIELAFEHMKKKNGASYGTFYTLDNGSYNRGLRTYDGTFTTQDLKEYDRQNVGNSGNFLYITGRANGIETFPTDTIFTKNIRTKDDESYKAGHDTINEQRGFVLHHTGFMDDPDMSKVTELLTKKDGNSAHVLINLDGSRRVLATPDKVTFHAGQSVWNNRDNVNDFMLGIEFQGDTNQKDLTPQQIKSAVEYMLPIIRERNIRLEDIVTHELVRDLYNDYALKNKAKTAPKKLDINLRNYEKIILALLQTAYYRK